MTTSPRRPALRYHGAKWKLAPWILSHFPDHRIYTEAFGGGASVLLRKKRSYAEVYNDLDGELVNLFTVIRDNGEVLMDRLYYTPYARSEFELSYEPTDDPVEQARRTIVRSFLGFGSNAHNQKTGFRSFCRRQNASPGHDWRNYPAALAAVVDRLRGVHIENRDAIKVIQGQDSEDTLHYVDPPYLPSTRDKGQDYAFEMTREQHEQLAANLHELKGMVILSGYRSGLYDELYKDWRCIQRKALADGARERVECLWLNPLATALQNQLSIF